MTDAELQKINAYAESLLDMPSFEESADPETLLKSEMALVNEFTNACRNKDYSIFTEPVSEAIKKARKDIWSYTGQFQKLIDKAQAEIDKLDMQEAQIKNHNQSVTSNTYDLVQERAKLGFFDGARKKEIDAELAKWQRKEIPPELEQERQKLKEVIKQYQEFIYPWQDKVKGITFYEGEAEAHTEAQRKEQKRSRTQTQAPKKSVREALKEKQELIKASQEPREAPKEAPKIKDLKEVHKPNLKPLKRL
ncbi:MAG: hypothetical protein IJN43_13625 [Ruminococcus sp.]|nr:hypothetical protein [Ruminococcus sp.]